jgi:hypothetical protein
VAKVEYHNDEENERKKKKSSRKIIASCSNGFERFREDMFFVV